MNNTVIPILRPDGRLIDELRPIGWEPYIAPHADGSVLISFGNTRIICAANLEKKVPAWMQQAGNHRTSGWITAEYSLLPYSTLERKTREISRGKIEGRNVEIQRFIGRALRAVVDLQQLPGFTLWIDCDVLQADGGTRTASITGAYIAARLAVDKFLKKGILLNDPFRSSVAAVSVGIYKNTELLDLNYEEDKEATVDFNVVMTGQNQFVEMQGAGEETSFSEEQLFTLLSLAKKGIGEIAALQKQAIMDASH